MERGIFLASLFLIAGQTVANSCPSSDNESVLQPGYQYWYDFKTEAVGEAVGTTDDRGRIIIQCTVHISHAHDCLYYLMMQDCTLSAVGGPPETETAWIDKRKLTELSRFPITFTLINGDIKNVYVDDKDPVFFLNIKRGALSAFVFKLSASRSKIHELHTDIHGTCPWHSVPVSNGYVKVSKNMLYCAFPNRPDWQFSPWSLFWNMTFIQYQMNSTFDCEYKIDNEHKRLEKMDCKERHAIGLESTHRTATAVQTNVFYHMTLEKSEKLKDKLTHPLPTTLSDIRFEYEKTADPNKNSEPHNFIIEAERMLSNMVEMSQEEMQLSAVPKFTDFVAWLRSSHDLRSFVNRVKNCLFLRGDLLCTNNIKELAMSYLSDALVQCNTVPCYQTITDLAISNDLSAVYLNFVLYSWNNMHFTKPGIIKHVKQICEVKDTRFCWLTLGTIVNNYRGKITDDDYPVELKDVASYFHHALSPYCDADDLNSDVERLHKDKYNRLMIYLKAIGNIGSVYSTYLPGGIRQLLRCTVKESLPLSIRIVSLEALYKMNACKHAATCNVMHSVLRPMLISSSVDVSLRIEIYRQFMLTPEILNFEEDLLNLLKTEKNTQMLSYVASNLNNHMNDAEYKKRNERFIHKMSMLLETNDINLDDLSGHQEGKSHYTAYGKFMKLPFLPENIQGFGVKYDSSVIFSFYNMIPRVYRTSATLQLFNKVVDFIQTGGYVEEWGDVPSLIQHMVKELHGKPLSLELFSHILTAIEKFSQQDTAPTENFPFNQRIVKNIQKIHKLFHQRNPTLEPSFNLYLNMFGNTLGMLNLQDLSTFKSLQDMIRHLMAKAKEGITYNSTSVIRLIEAYHQVPTMMGLPLNWTTDATFAFSFKKGLKFSLERHNADVELRGSGFFHPSMVLTFLNRMVVDFPTFTQIGVQANSSGFTSTQWKARVDYSDSNNERLVSLEAPQKPQKILELFRTNQLIKHDAYTNIPDWDIQRKASAWCSPEKMSSILGFEICHERSYPQVTHLIKPWALMAGWCKWTLETRPYDRDVKSYNFFIKNIELESEKEIKLIFDAPGSIYKREIVLKLRMPLSYDEMTATINVMELPNFSFTLSRAKLFDGDQVKGHRILANIVLTEKLKYQLSYENENSLLTPKVEKYENKSPKPKKLIALIQQRSFNIETPYNIYKYNRKIHYQGKNVKAHVFMAYENLDSEWNWLSELLPQTFWDTPSKAWIKMRLNSKSSPQTIVGSVDTPRTSIQLESNSLAMPGRVQHIFNLTKTDVRSGNLLNFANFTYNGWNSASDGLHSKEIRMLNFTIPKRSWGLRTETIKEDTNTLFHVTLSQAQMATENDVDGNEYVGWWSDDDRFSYKLHELKFKADIDGKLLESSELLQKVPSLKEQDIANLKNQYVQANIEFLYPSTDREESIKFDGYFITSISTTVFRYQKDFVLTSSYHDLRLNSHSIYRSENRNRWLAHNSYFTHAGSETKAFYNLDFKEVHHTDDCFDIDFSHNISSHVLDFASNVNYYCDISNPELRTLVLNLDSHSTYWDMLNSQIRQKIEGTPSFSHETMNFSHPLMNINVTAEWHENEHLKKAVFTKTLDNSPVVILNLESRRPWKTKLTLDIFNNGESGAKIIYQRKFTDEFRGVKVNLLFPDENHKALTVYGKIQNPRQRIWTIYIHPQLSGLFRLFKDFGEKISVTAGSVATDADHPINKILKPALKMPLSQYLSSITQSIQTGIRDSLNAVKDIFIAVSPIYEVSIDTITRILSASAKQIHRVYSALEEKSITIWAIKYFQLPSLFQQGLANISGGLNVIKNVLMPPNEIQKYVIHTGDMFVWKSFKELPIFTFFSDRKKQDQRSIRPHYHRFKKSKIGLIFGPTHVYTFDGIIFEFPKYPSQECVYLLAHDTYKSKFSVLSSSDSIHVLFPEISITINSLGQVYVNGSQSQHALPLQSTKRNIFVRQEGKVIKVSSPFIVVSCDVRSQLCVLELSGWSGGRTIGILGNADGEVHNEYNLPDGSTTNDLLEFVKPYELSGKPQCEQLKYPDVPVPLHEQKNRCNEALHICDSYSYKKKEFLPSCVIDINENDDTCYTAAALSALCYFENVAAVSNCNVQQQESKRIRHKIEVILLVDEHISMLGDTKTNLVKGIESTITAIEQQFRDKGYANIVYSLIGFGGTGVHFHPSVHAVDSNTWVHYEMAVNKLLKTLDFKGTVKGDPIAALRYAVEVLGYDTFDSKVIIIFTQTDQQEAKKSRLHLIQSYLEKNHITLYTISSYPTIQKGKKVYGIRADGLMFPSSESTEAYLDYPRGDLAKLTSGTKGSLFLKNFVELNGPQSFFTEFAQEVWAKVRKEVNYCRQCKTIQSGWWFAFNECHLIECKTT